MNALTTRERRGMTAISTAAGRMLIVAADQRNTMKAVMTDAPGGPVSDADSSRRPSPTWSASSANSAPAILLDPEVALPRVVDDGTLARGTALVVGMDASGYETVDGLRYTRLVAGVTARRVRELGGDVAKMLFYVRPDRQDAGSPLADQIRELVRECAEEGILLIVELLTYQLDGESDDAYRAAFPGLVADGARLAEECGAKMLKLQYPGSAEGCAAVTAAAAGVPWAVLSAGVDHATFLKQVASPWPTARAGPWRGARSGRTASPSRPRPGRTAHHARAAPPSRARRRRRRALLTGRPLHEGDGKHGAAAVAPAGVGAGRGSAAPRDVQREWVLVDHRDGRTEHVRHRKVAEGGDGQVCPRQRGNQRHGATRVRGEQRRRPPGDLLSRASAAAAPTRSLAPSATSRDRR